MRSLLLRIGDALVVALLGLYPGPFRRRYGGEMRQAFRAQAESRLARGGWAALPGLWVRTAVGMVRGAFAERTGRRRGGEMAKEAEGAGFVQSAAAGLGQAARRLARDPVFTALAVATLGLGVGAFASVWAVVESVVLEPLPYEEPDELAWVWRDYTAWFDLSRGWLGGPDLAYMQEDDAVFEAASAVQAGRMNLTGREGIEPREIRTFLTSASLFDLLGTGPVVGRGFLPGEDAPGAPAVVVLTHDLWVDAFGRAPDILGREVRLDGEPFEVVGVLPEDFAFLMPTSLGDPAPADAFLPLRMDLAAQNPGSGFLAGLVRIRSEVPDARVEASLARVADRVDEGWAEGHDLRLWTAPAKEDLIAEVRPALVAILAAAGFLLLVLAANLATLLLARASLRARDTAVRVALGAGRGTVAGGAFAEVALLTGAGALLGVFLAARGAELLTRVAGSTIPRSAEVGLDGSGVLVCVAVAVMLGALAALGPLATILGTEPGRALRAAGARGGESRGRVRSRNALVVVQVALSVVLLVGAGLLTRNLAGLLRSDPGFDPGETLTFRVALDPTAYADDPAVVELLDRLERRLAAVPSVRSVGATDALPLSASTSQTGVVFPGAPGNTGDPDADSPLVDILRITPGYVAAAGLRLLDGAPLPERSDGPLDVLIDDVLARRFFPEGLRGGERLVVNTDTAAIAGVVDQARAYDVHTDGRGQVYVPMSQNATSAFSVAVRTTGRPEALTDAARTAVREIDPTVPVSEVRTLEQVVTDSLRGDRLNLLLVGVFALAALLLAGLGIYGVVANAVVARRREIGVRMAVGAAAAEVVRMVLGQGFRLVAAGAAIGLVGAVFASRVLTAVLQDVDRFDGTTYASVTLLLVVVAGLAAWLPARRATRVDPTEALRAE